METETGDPRDSDHAEFGFLSFHDSRTPSVQNSNPSRPLSRERSGLSKNPVPFLPAGASGSSRPHSREAPIPGSRPASRPATREKDVNNGVQQGRRPRKSVAETGHASADKRGKRDKAGHGGKKDGKSAVSNVQKETWGDALKRAIDACDWDTVKSLLMRPDPEKAKEEQAKFEHLVDQLNDGKKKTSAMTSYLRASMNELAEDMDAHDAEKSPTANLRAQYPNTLDPLDPGWLQTDDMGLVREVMDDEAKQAGADPYQDEYSVIDNCKFKYNPVDVSERFLPAVGVRALLTYRGVAMEILGPPREKLNDKRWKRRMALLTKTATCGPMDRPKGAAVDILQGLNVKAREHALLNPLNPEETQEALRKRKSKARLLQMGTW